MTTMAISMMIMMTVALTWESVGPRLLLLVSPSGHSCTFTHIFHIWSFQTFCMNEHDFFYILPLCVGWGLEDGEVGEHTGGSPSHVSGWWKVFWITPWLQNWSDGSGGFWLSSVTGIQWSSSVSFFPEALIPDAEMEWGWEVLLRQLGWQEKANSRSCFPGCWCTCTYCSMWMCSFSLETKFLPSKWNPNKTWDCLHPLNHRPNSWKLFASHLVNDI